MLRYIGETQRVGCVAYSQILSPWPSGLYFKIKYADDISSLPSSPKRQHSYQRMKLVFVNRGNLPHAFRKDCHYCTRVPVHFFAFVPYNGTTFTVVRSKVIAKYYIKFSEHPRLPVEWFPKKW